WIVSPPVTRETGGQFPDGETVLVLLFFFCPGLSRRKAKRRASCIGRESNPGLPRGRREFYHGTTNARHIQRRMAENEKPPRTTELLLKGQQRRMVEKRETTKIELLLKGQQRRIVKKRATPKWSRLSHLIYVPKYFLQLNVVHWNPLCRGIPLALEWGFYLAQVESYSHLKNAGRATRNAWRATMGVGNQRC